MSLFQSTTPAQDSAAQLLQLVTNQYNALVLTATNGYALVWQNLNASPPEVITALGTNARAVFTLATINAQMLTAAAQAAGIPAPTLPSIPPEYQVTFNPDGSATVTMTATPA